MITTNTQIKSTLRRLFLRSRERAEALKRDKYTCVKCGVKQSQAKGKVVKVEVHHKLGVMNWGYVINSIRLFLLCDPSKMETLCKECHKK